LILIVVALNYRDDAVAIGAIPRFSGWRRL
jgi:hypothetical protein